MVTKHTVFKKRNVISNIRMSKHIPNIASPDIQSPIITGNSPAGSQ